MLDYTNAAIEKIKNDFSKISNFFTGAIKASLILYLFYAIIAPMGNLYLNIPLLIVAAVDLGFFVYYLKAHFDKKTKQHFYDTIKWLRRIIKLFNVALIVYSIILTAQNVSAISLIFSAITITAWILDVTFFFLSKFIIPWLEYLVIGVQTDINPVVKVLNKFQDKETVVLNGTLPSPVRDELTKIVMDKKKQEEEYEEELKASKKQAKIQAKTQKKQDKKNKKQAKKNAKRNPAPSVSEEAAVSEDNK